jgi:general secretion pathway protein L
MNPVRLILLPRGPDAPILYRVVEDGRTAERGVLTPGQPAPHPDLPAVAVVPGEDVACRWLGLPAGREAQAAAAAGFLLDDQLAGPRETLHIAVGRPEADGQRLAVVVDRARMQAWLDRLAAVAVAPRAVVPDHLLVPEPAGEATAAVRLTDGAYAVRGPRLALTCDADLLEAVAGPGRRIVDDPAEGERLMAAGAEAPPVDLRQGAFAPAGAGPTRRVNWLAVAAGLLALSLPAAPGVEAFRHHLAAERAEGRAQALAGPAPAGAASGDTTSGDAVGRLRSRLARRQAAEGFLAAVAAVFAEVRKVDGMELQELLYGEDGALRINVAHPNYTDIELLRTGLVQAGLAVEEASTMTEGDRIVSDLVVRPRR